MKVIRDNLIYFRQKVGGISTYFNRLSFLEISDSSVVCIRSKFLLIPDIYYSSDSYVVHCTYYKPVFAINGKVVYTIHDLNFKLFESRTLRNTAFSLLFRWSLSCADGLIIISRYTEKQLRRFYPKLSCKCNVIYHGIETIQSSPKSIEKIKELLYVGKRHGYKKFIEFIDLLPVKNFNLTLVGGEALTLEEKASMDKIFIEWRRHEFLDSEKLDNLYASSDLLIYPSAYEGFGLPIIEAARMGTPTIFQEGTSCSEIGNQLGLRGFISWRKESIDNFIKEIEREYGFLSQQLIANVEIFSLDRCLKEHKKFYYEIFDYNRSLQ